MAIVINSEWRNYVKDIEPKSERCMVMRLRRRPQVSLVAAYAPTAQSETKKKDNFWGEIKQTVKEEDSSGIVVVMADLNARIRARQAGEERYVGVHTFDKSHTRRKS